MNEAKPAGNGGRDPLGLTRLSALIADTSPHGITTTKRRARYYSAYAWCLRHIEEEDALESNEQFVKAMRMR